MASDPDSEKLDVLAARIKQAQAKPGDGLEAEDAKPVKMSGVGFEFLGSILGGTFIGWLIDRQAGTGPWGLILMIFVGFGAGMYRVWKAMDSQK